MKTRIFQTLHDYLLGQHALISEKKQKTPEKRIAKAQEIKQFFFDEKKPLIKTVNKQVFRVALRRLQAKHLEAVLYDNANETLDEKQYPYPLPDEKEITAQFLKFENEHAFFTENKTQAEEQYKTYFKITKIIGDFIEENNTEINDVAYEHAYKLLVLFGDNSKPTKLLHSLDTYLAIHNFQEKNSPVHDALVWALPKNIAGKPQIHLKEWRHIIHNKGPRGLRLFAKAFEIEEKLEGNAPKDFSEAFNIAKLITYKKIAEAPELAELCMFYDVNEEVFNRCLEIKKQTKENDLLPNITVDGNEVGHPGYYLVKLPIQDPRAFILGHITDCCQSIGGHSEKCVIDGVTLKSNGFYVLLKAKNKNQLSPFIQSEDKSQAIDYAHFDILGQGYAWLSYWGNLVFDSWENLRPAKESKETGILLQDDAVIVPMLQKFGEFATEQKETSILQVTIGRGGKTPKYFRDEKIKLELPEKMREGTPYGDSTNQSVIYCNDKQKQQLINRIHTALKAITKLENEDSCFDSNCIISKEQANFIENFLITNEVLKRSLQNGAAREQLNSMNHAAKGALWIALAFLDKFNLFTKENLEQLFMLTNVGIQSALNDFYCRKFINAIEDLYYADSLKEVFHILFFDSEKASHYLGAYISDYVPGLVTLKKAELLDKKYVQLVINSNTYATKVSQALATLKKINLLTPENIAHISQNAKTSDTFADVIEAFAMNMPQSDFDYQNALRDACYHNDKKLVALIIEKNILNLKDENVFLEKRYSSGLLNRAIEHGDLELIKILTNAGIPLEKKDPDGKTAFHYAVKNGDHGKQIIPYLLEQKLDINAADLEGATPLTCSIFYWQLKLTAQLLEYKELVIDREKLLTEKYFTYSSYWENQIPEEFAISKAMAVLDETKLLTQRNFAILVDNDRSHERRAKGELVYAFYQQKKLTQEVLDWMNQVFAYNKNGLIAFIDLVFKNNIPLAQIKLEKLENLDSEACVKSIVTLTDNNILNAENINVVLYSGGHDSYLVTEQLLKVNEKINLKKNNFNDDFVAICFRSGTGGLLNLMLDKNLIDINKDLTTSDGKRFSPLNFAIENNNEDVIRILLHSRATIESKDSCPRIISTLRDVNYCSVKLLNMLLTAGANLQVTDSQGSTPLHYAASHHNPFLLDFFLEHKADVNAVNQEHETPLFFAIKKKAISAVLVNLIEAKANIACTNKSGDTPLSVANKENNILAKSILELHALGILNEDTLELLESNKENNDFLDELTSGIKILHANMQMYKLKTLAQAAGYAADYAKFITKSVKDPKFANDLFLSAIKFGDLETACLLKTAYKIDANICDFIGDSALLIALKHKQREAAKYLLKQPEIQFTSDKSLGAATPMLLAIKNGYNEVVSQLLAIKLGFFETISYQFGTNSQARVNFENKYGITPVQQAIIYAQEKTLEMLIIAHAEVNAKNRYGVTPLELAILEANKISADKDPCKMIRILLSYRADINIMNKDGKSLLEFAKNQDVRELLEKAVAKQKTNSLTRELRT